MNQPYSGSNYCSDHFGILTKFTEDVAGIDESMNKQGVKFRLYQNYPNPFNPNTVISWQLVVDSRAILKVYDIIGNEVATLVDEELPIGEYKVEFDASNYSGSSGSFRRARNLPGGRQGLTSGVYFYQLNAKNYSKTKKMVLIR